MTTAEIESLLERVRRATGPDRELDAIIDAVVIHDRELIAGNYAPTNTPCVLGRNRHPPYDSYVVWCAEATDIVRVPLHTASVDACLALIERVQPGWVIAHIGEDYTSPPKHTIGWTVELEQVDGPTFQGQAPTLPLALLEALLLALLHQASRG